MDILKLKIEQGEYSLGQIVVPQNFTKTAIKDGKMITEEVSISGRKFAIKDGKMITEEVPISGRKFPLEDIRKNLLICHANNMHLTTDEEFENMELNEVQQKLKNLREFSENSETLQQLLIKLKNGMYPLF